jgi:hypothetical protein
MTVAFPDPKSVPDNFTGCLNTWLALSNEDVRIFEAKFVDGKIRWLKSGSGQLYCEYEGDRVVRQHVAPEVIKEMEVAFPKFEFCPPGSTLGPSKWK